MPLQILIPLVILFLIVVLSVCAEYSFIDSLRKRGFIQKGSEYHMLVFIFLYPEYHVKAPFLAFKRTNDHELEVKRKLFLFTQILIIIYFLGVWGYINLFLI